MEEIQQNQLVDDPVKASRLDFNLDTIIKVIILHWSWFILSTIICVSAALIYLRYATPIYYSWAKLLIRDEENAPRTRNSLAYDQALGTVFNSSGIDNEIEILKSRTLAEDAVRKAKLNIVYTTPGRVTTHFTYLTQPITVSMDSLVIEEMHNPTTLTITRTGKTYHITGTTYARVGEGYKVVTVNDRFTTLPHIVSTEAGNIYLTQNGNRVMSSGGEEDVSIVSPRVKSFTYAARINAAPTSKQTSIALLNIDDEVRQRGVDYLKALTDCYNQLANDDKNEVARRTEEFINERLVKLQGELGVTEGNIESYKREQELVEPQANASISLQGNNQYKQKLVDAEVQLELLNSIAAFIRQPENKYQALVYYREPGGRTDLLVGYQQVQFK